MNPESPTTMLPPTTMPTTTPSPTMPPTMPPTTGGRSRRRRSSKRRGMRGGTSGWQSVFGAVGGGNQQWNNVFGESAPAGNGNLLTHANGSPQMSVASTAAAAGKGPFSMTGGRRGRGRRHKHSKMCRHKRGGTWGGMIGQALVPFGLLATQRATARRSGRLHTKKNRSRRRR